MTIYSETIVCPLFDAEQKLLQKLKKQWTEQKFFLKERTSKVYQETILQTGLAMSFLKGSMDLYHELLGTDDEVHAKHFLLPRLIPAAILFFKSRDLLAFEWIYHSPIYTKIALGEKLKQYPMFEQLLAVIESKKKEENLWNTLTPEDYRVIEALDQLKDQELGIQVFKQFRDMMIHQGVPLDDPELTNEPFETQVMDYLMISQSALNAWKKFRDLMSIYRQK
jgi:hypothetical protein